MDRFGRVIWRKLTGFTIKMKLAVLVGWKNMRQNIISVIAYGEIGVGFFAGVDILHEILNVTGITQPMNCHPTTAVVCSEQKASGTVCGLMGWTADACVHFIDDRQRPRICIQLKTRPRRR